MLYIPFREKLIKMVLSLKQTRDNELVDNPYFSAYGGGCTYILVLISNFIHQY